MKKIRSFLYAMRIREKAVRCLSLTAGLALAQALAFSPQSVAAPLAGTSIGNQASATYSDASAVTRTVTSNTVTTMVQQVASLTLSAPGAKTVTPGGQVFYPHTLTNSGNGPDSFSLSSTNGSAFVFSSVTFYADANGDGLPDNGTPITSTGALAAGAAFHFVVVGVVPGTAASGQVNNLVVTAASVFDGTKTASNTDVTTITNNAVINITKSIDVGSGAAGDTRTYTLTYTNTGNSAAASLVITDVIPTGMTYVANSGRWSVTGATILTDANLDDQGGIVYDYNSGATRVTATIASVPPGTSGTLSFQVQVKSGLAPGANAATANVAAYAYNDGAASVPATNTNTVQFSVNTTVSVSLAGATVPSAVQGGTVSFSNTLTNNGNGTDSFDVTIGASTFPPGTAFALYRSDGVTPMQDTNGNGTPDTGPVAAGATYVIVVKATLPPGASGGPYTVQKIATSKQNPAQSATATDTLTAITANTVDLTNTSALPGAPGAGAGPEASPVVNNTVVPGNTSRFVLYVNNTSGTADTYNLQASTDSSFGSLALPAGWTVVFRDSAEAVISNTGVVNAGASKLVYADVSVPAGYAPGVVDVYFRSVSPSSGSADRLHDAVTVSTVRKLTLAPNNSAQIYPGGSVVFTHTVTNAGNVTEGDGAPSAVTLSTGDSNPNFTSIVYWDKNNNGILDVNDPPITDLSALTGGTNGASTAAGLSPGESATLFVKVQAASGAAAGVSNTTTLTATTVGVIGGAAAPGPATATDNSTVIAGQLSLNKLQALDAACDGTADTAFGSTTITTGAIPGACIRYQITATNVGVSSITNVLVNDATPVNTVYTATGPAATTIGTVPLVPADASPGSIQVDIGTLTPGQSAVVTFGVRISP